MVSRLIFKSFIHLEFIFCVWCKLAIEFHFLICSYPVLPTPFVEEAIFTPFYVSAPFVTYLLNIEIEFISGLCVLFHWSKCLFYASTRLLVPGVIVPKAVYPISECAQFHCSENDTRYGARRTELISVISYFLTIVWQLTSYIATRDSASSTRNEQSHLSQSYWNLIWLNKIIFWKYLTTFSLRVSSVHFLPFFKQVSDCFISNIRL